jgi:hypothetical protein
MAEPWTAAGIAALRVEWSFPSRRNRSKQARIRTIRGGNGLLGRIGVLSQSGDALRFHRSPRFPEISIPILQDSRLESALPFPDHPQSDPVPIPSPPPRQSRGRPSLELSRVHPDRRDNPSDGRPQDCRGCPSPEPRQLHGRPSAGLSRGWGVFGGRRLGEGGIGGSGNGLAFDRAESGG